MAEEPKPGSLVNFDLDSVSEVGKLLIDKVSDAVGGLARPWQTKRQARADAEASKILAEAEVVIDEMNFEAISRRVANARLQEEERVSAITMFALSDLREDARPEEIESDWLLNFFDRGKIISDPDMQILWSHLLSDEANNSGSVSRKTVNILSDLGKSDAERFAKVCNFAVNAPEPRAMILEYGDDFFKDNGAGFDDLNHLDSLGLIHFSGVGSFTVTFQGGEGVFKYGDAIFRLRHLGGKPITVEMGKVLFTTAGHEILRACKTVIVPGFADKLRSHFESTGMLVPS